jgi:hypothetical protein
MNAEEFQRLSGEVIGAAIEVHWVPGCWSRLTKNVLRGN